LFNFVVREGNEERVSRALRVQVEWGGRGVFVVDVFFWWRRVVTACLANVEVSLDSGVWIWMCCRVRLSLSTEVFESVAGATAHVCVSSDTASF
jgi:hypothetical protein